MIVAITALCDVFRSGYCLDTVISICEFSGADLASNNGSQTFSTLQVRALDCHSQCLDVYFISAMFEYSASCNYILID